MHLITRYSASSASQFTPALGATPRDNPCKVSRSVAKFFRSEIALRHDKIMSNEDSWKGTKFIAVTLLSLASLLNAGFAVIETIVRVAAIALFFILLLPTMLGIVSEEFYFGTIPTIVGGFIPSAGEIFANCRSIGRLFGAKESIYNKMMTPRQ